jgi:transposase
MTNLMETLYFLGIDISKKKFDAALTVDGKHFHEVQIENLSKSIESFFRDLKKQLSSLSKLIVCLEHTGIYCQPLLDFLVKNNIQVCLEPALQIKQSQGMIRGKTDQIDAKRIALYAFKNRENLTFWKPQRHCIQKLKALLVTRERLVKIKVQLEVPIQECEEFIEPQIRKDMVKHCRKTLNAVQSDIDKIEQAIDRLVKEDSQLTEQCALATSVPGIGKITALNVIISTGEFKKIREAKKLACYAGVAPFEHRSGSSIRGKTRVSKMANMTLKRLFHLAAMSAIRCCEELKAFYKRKLEAGKNKMSVINAVRNKLISRIYACINNNRRYQKIYQNPLA